MGSRAGENNGRVNANEWLASFCLCAIAIGCHSTPLEDKLRLWIGEAVDEAEHGDASGLLDRLSGDFRLIPGGTGKQELRQRMLYVVSRTRGSRIYYPRPDVDPAENGAQAEVSFSFLLLKGNVPEPSGKKEPAEWLGELADRTRLMRITLWLRDEDGDWYAYQVRLEKFTGTGFKPLREY